MHFRTVLSTCSIPTLLMLGLLSGCRGNTPEATASPNEQAQTETAAAATTQPEAPKAEPAPEAAAEDAGPKTWWPEQVNLSALRKNNDADPYGDFDYGAAFEKVDLAALKKDITAVLTDSQDWWPADYGNYGPLFIRMAWHSAGTYRVHDGRGGAAGGQQRFEPLNSWPDNANLDKARRLLWPVKQKYGRNVSWADLMVLAGNVAMESMGFKTLGFAGGRADDWQAEVVNWGPETTMLASKRHHGDRKLKGPLAAARMGLIYVNPEGPNGKPDPLAAAQDIRKTFARMAMDDEETVALIAGGHTFGKAHGAHKAGDCLGVEPAAGDVADQGMGWHNKCGTGKGVDTVTSGLEGAWTSAPVRWTHQYLTFLFGYEWELTKSPGGASQWKPTDPKAQAIVPDAHDASRKHAPMMLTTDLALREDPAYSVIARRFLEDPRTFEQAFARAWFKLTHRDMGPRSRYRGSEVPKESFAWQDPLPEAASSPIRSSDVSSLKRQILATGLDHSALVRASWAAASSYRGTDMRGGANGGRIRLAPQKDWQVNEPAELAQVLQALGDIQEKFNKKSRRKVSLADLVVLAGAAAIEEAAKKAGHKLKVPFKPGRVDSSAEQTDVQSFAYLEPMADGFRNYYTDAAGHRPADALVDKAAMLGLDVRGMTALVGGLRVLGANAGGKAHGVFTTTPGVLNNHFFVNLLDLSTRWSPTENYNFEGRGADGAIRWTATEADLVFGSNAELRAVSEVYAIDEAKFLEDFVAAWVKVMQADRFDLK